MNATLTTTTECYVPELTGGRNYPAGAMLLALLVDPPVARHRKDWMETYRFLCHCGIVDLVKNDPLVELSEPEEASYKDKPARFVQRMNRICRQANNRLAAAHMAIGRFQVAETGEHSPLPKYVRRLSINQMSSFMLVRDETNEKDERNLIARVWSPSKPVIHIASALAIEMDLFEKENGREITLPEILSNLDFVRHVIYRAALLEELIGKTKLEVKRKELIKVRMPDWILAIDNIVLKHKVRLVPRAA